MSLQRHIAILSWAIIVYSGMPVLPVFATQITADSLVGYWKLDETSGTSAVDLSGNGKTGTHQNSPSISSFFPTLGFTNARALSFSAGLSNYVSTTLSRPTSGTISLWAYSNGYNNFMSPAGWKLTGASNGYTAIDESSGVPKWRAIYRPNNSGNTEVVVSAASNMTQNVWQHVAMTWSVSGTTHTIALYVNGVSQGSTTWIGTTGTGGLGNFNFGKSGDFAGNYFSGLLDDVRVYDRALSQSELTDLAAGNHPTATWDGSTNTSFENGANWDTNVVPDPYTRIVVPYTANKLTLTGAVQTAGMTVNTGTILFLNGTGVTIQDGGTLTNYGTIAAKNSRDVLTGVNMPTDKGTVMLMGTGTTSSMALGSSYYNLTINDGLMTYLKFDETSGTRAADTSGYYNSGSLLNGAAFSSIVPSLNFANPRSVAFDGINDYVQLPEGVPTQLLGSGSKMVTMWVYPTQAQNGFFYMGPGGGGVQGESLRIVTTSAGLLQIDISSGVVTTALTVPQNKWSLVSVSWNARTSEWIACVNGLCEVLTLPQSRLAQGYAFIGYNQAGNRFTKGNIDDVRIYNHVLTSGEIGALAAGNQPSVALASVALDDSTNIYGNLTLNGGTLDVSSSNYQLNVFRSWVNNGGVFNPRHGIVYLTGEDPSLTVLSGGQRFNDVAFDATGATWTLQDNLTASGTLSLTTGTLDVNATGNYTVRADHVTQSNGSLTARAGTLVLTSAADSTFTLTDSLNTLRIEDPTESGLVGYWKFDEGTNTGTIIDSSGNGFTAMRRGTGALVWTGSTLPSLTFANPYAMQFNGISDTVDLPTSLYSRWNDLTAGSVAMWVRINAFSEDSNHGFSDMFFAKQNNGVHTETALGIDDSSHKLRWHVDAMTPDSGDLIGSSTLSPGTWYHVVGTFDGSTHKLYINGVLDASQNSSEVMEDDTSPSYMRIAKWGGASPDIAFAGAIDDVRLYNRAISANEIANLYGGRYAAGNTSTATVTLGDDLAVHYLALDSGNLNTDSYDLSITNSLTMLRGRGNLTVGVGATTLGGLTMSGAAIITTSGTLDINGDVSFQTGSLSAPSGYLTLSGNWTKTGGYFTANGGTFLLDGTDQTLSGTDTFYNLTKSVTSPATLTFGAGETVTVEGMVTLNGSSDVTLLSLRSSTDGAAWLFNPTGTRGLEYVDVQDSTNIHATAIDCIDLGCIDSGNNTNWTFVPILSSSSESSSNTSREQAAGGGRGKRTGLLMALQARADIQKQYKQTVVRSDEEVPTHAAGDDRASSHSSSSATITVANSTPVIERQRNRVVLAAGDMRLLYKDVVADAWYAPYVSKVIEENVARGYKDENGQLTGEFGVGKAVTKAEILKMALEASGQNHLKAAAPRNTSAQGSWAAAYVGIAESLSLSTFTPDTDVNAPATRAQVVQLIMETMGITIGKTTSTFSDVPKNHPNTSAIAAAAFFGIIEGDTKADGTPLNTFRPDEQINRAEASKLIALARALKKMGLIAPPAVGGVSTAESSSASSTSSSVAAPELKQAKVITQQLKLRIDSRSNADWVATIYNGHVVTILWPLDNGWSYIKTSYGVEGYVESKYLEPIQ